MKKRNFTAKSFKAIVESLVEEVLEEQSSLGGGMSSMGPVTASAWSPKSSLKDVYDFLWSGDEENQASKSKRKESKLKSIPKE